jgi:hypothetical protein
VTYFGSYLYLREAEIEMYRFYEKAHCTEELVRQVKYVWDLQLVFVMFLDILNI